MSWNLFLKEMKRNRNRFLIWASPFRYVDTHVSAAGYGLEWWRVLYLAGLSVILCALTFVIYRRKDILI